MENNGIRLNSKVESTQVAMNIYTIESQSISCKYVNKIYIRISSFTLQYNYDKTTWKLIKIRKWYSKLWCSENIAYIMCITRTFEGENFHKLWSFVAICKSVLYRVWCICLLVAAASNWWKFTTQKSFFHQFMKVFSCKNFLFYNICFRLNRYQHLSVPLLDKPFV